MAAAMDKTLTPELGRGTLRRSEESAAHLASGFTARASGFGVPCTWPD